MLSKFQKCRTTGVWHWLIGWYDEIKVSLSVYLRIRGNLGRILLNISFFPTSFNPLNEGLLISQYYILMGCKNLKLQEVLQFNVRG